MPVKLTIIGAGPGGYVAAVRAAQKGALVTVVESAEVGGTCLNQGCIPTKTIIASAEALERVRAAGEFGVEVSGAVCYSLEKIRERREKVVSTQVKGIRSLFKSWGVSLIEGRGSLLSPDVVRVVQKDGTTMDVKSDRVIIATGSRPAVLPGRAFDGERVMSSDDAVLLKRIPKSLIIIGAGVIGSEFAFIYRTFGAEMTMVEMLTRAIATEDDEMADLIEREFKKAKIKLITNVKVDGLTRTDGGLLSARLSNGQEVGAEAVLVSVGRALNSGGLGLEDVGVKIGSRGEVLVNEKMETSVAGIYAVGDVTAKNMLAHVASHQGLVAVDNALGGAERMDYGVIPSGIFTMPEIGSVGLRGERGGGEGCQV